MTALAHPLTALEVRTANRSVTRELVNRPTLVASEDGWSLLGGDGELLFRGFGVDGRRQCLEAARARGLLAVFS